MAAAKKSSGTVRIRLVRGLAGKRKEHIKTVNSLGLRRPHQAVERPDTPEIRGQIFKVRHLVEVEES